jgi:hypothetical protein
MSITRSIKCDNCGAELVIETSYPHKFTIELGCIDTGIKGNTTYALNMEPPIRDKKHFCNLGCLKEWLAK